jgi:hypothetical protein
VLSSTPGNAKPIFRTVSKLIVLLGMGAIIRQNMIAGTAITVSRTRFWLA